MAITEEWPVGERHAHHGLEGERVQRELALLFREHHTKDAHTHDGNYAAIDEAFTRLDVLERPTTAKRLFRLRAIAKARALRRQYNQEANWLVANDEHLHYQHRLRLHEADPDTYNHPGTTGLELRTEDSERIGPTKDDIDIECDARIDDLRPRLSELLLFQGENKFTYPGESDRVMQLLDARVVAIESERNRALLLKALDSVGDDYFEPKYWGAINSDLRNYVQLAQLGVEPQVHDPWHNLAREGLALADDGNEFLAVCSAVIRARDNSKTYPLWTNPPNSIPTVNVTVSAFNITFTWSGTMPTGVTVLATLVQATGLTADSPFHISASESPKTITFAGEKIAILVQLVKEPEQAGGDTLRSRGDIRYVGDLNP